MSIGKLSNQSTMYLLRLLGANISRNFSLQTPIYNAYMHMFRQLPGILREYYEPCRNPATATATATTTTAVSTKAAQRTNSWGNNIEPEPEPENWESLSGGSYKSYVHVPNFGKRLVRYRKNGKAYVILKGKKKNLYK